MNCPVCKSGEHSIELAAHSNGFDEELLRCQTCSTLWAINHGKLQIVEEPLPGSFLQAGSEMVEGDDYNSSSP
jgi:hypothetical protein